MQKKKKESDVLLSQSNMSENVLLTNRGNEIVLFTQKSMLEKGFSMINTLLGFFMTLISNTFHKDALMKLVNALISI